MGSVCRAVEPEIVEDGHAVIPVGSLIVAIAESGCTGLLPCASIAGLPDFQASGAILVTVT